MRLFLDANVLFAAVHSPGGRSRALFELAARGACTLVASPHVLAEARRNLALKSAANERALDELLELVKVVGEADPRLVTWASQRGLPANDAPVLAAAVAADVDALVTGDRTHFGHLYGATAGGVSVLSLADAIASLVR